MADQLGLSVVDAGRYKAVANSHLRDALTHACDTARSSASYRSGEMLRPAVATGPNQIEISAPESHTPVVGSDSTRVSTKYRCRCGRR